MKKLVSLFLALIMVISLCGLAFATSLEGTYDVKIWVGENMVDLTREQVENFNKTNELGITINPTIEAVSESEAGTNMVTDVEAGGDLFCFAQDQFARLVQAGALAQLGAGASEFVKTNNYIGTVEAATSGDAVYAYPLTADNGYFMYYDKSVIPEADIDSMEAIIADCEKADKYFAFDVGGSAWYLASFFFGTGCVSSWETDNEGQFISVKDTFDSPEGLIAAKGLKKLVDSKCYLSSASGSEFASGAAVVVSGTWDYETVAKILGDNFGVADLPSFEVDGTSYHLGSFNGCKLMGVKPQTDAVKGAALHKLAQYLTGEECQMQRFEKSAWGPSNLNAQASEAVKTNPVLTALFQQNDYAVLQGQIHGSWWDIAKVITEDVKNATDEAGLQAALDSYKEKMAALFNLTEEEKTAWGVIGTCNLTDGFFAIADYSTETRSNWADDIPMEGKDGIWTTTQAYPMEAGTEFKVRQAKSWDNAFPADNFKVETAGTYFVQLNEATGEVTLVPAE